MLECLHLLTFENKTMNVYVSEYDYLVIQIKILRKSWGMPSPDFIILDQAWKTETGRKTINICGTVKPVMKCFLVSYF
jgi:hypothetical protein